MQVKQTEIFKPTIEQLSAGGCFIVAGVDEPNIMTIGWGTAGIMWGKQVYMTAVRVSRYTRELLNTTKEFTICVPKDSMKKELAFAGSKSGRDLNKAKELGLTFEASEKVAVPRLAGMEAVYEGKVVYETLMTGENLDPQIIKGAYPEGDYHILYFGEIVACHQF